MSNLNDLGLSDEKLPEETDLDSLPAEGFSQPQPGTYVFTLPKDMENLWEKFPTTAHGERVKANFKKGDEGDFRLQYMRGDKEKGFLSLSLSNMPIGKRPGKLAYLAAALGNKGTYETNKELADALSKHGGEQFIANIVYNAKNKNTGQKFATRPYTNKTTGEVVAPIPRDNNGAILFEFVDSGTLIRAFPDLEQFKPAK